MMACIGVEADIENLFESLYHYLSNMRLIEPQIDESVVFDLVGNIGELDQLIPSLSRRRLLVDRGGDVLHSVVVGPVGEHD